MMATIHAVVGLTLTVPLVWVTPDLATAVAVGALAGGAFPDVDLSVDVHRKMLHFPIYYSVAAAVFGGAAVVSPSTLTVGVVFFCLSAGLHSAPDWLGTGDEFWPWDHISDRVVYVHPVKRWLRPRYLVRHDGVPENLAPTLLLSVPGFLALFGGVRVAIAVGVAVAPFYTGFRKRMPEWFGIWGAAST